jgi:hypothetical protein
MIINNIDLEIYTIDLNDLTGKICTNLKCNKEDVYKIYGSIA